MALAKLIHPQREIPAYEALSYVWGSTENPSYVVIQGAITTRSPHSTISGGEAGDIVVITKNLDFALRHFRYEKAHRVLWIDALCIDQESKEEKNRQVAVMGKIYTRADRVLAWLGPEQDESNVALDVIERIGRHVEMDWEVHSLCPSNDCPDKETHWSNTSEDLPFREGSLYPIFLLITRPYFSRMWIRQEIVLATSITLVCGSRSIP